MNNNNNNDIIAARRQALAEALRQGGPVAVTPTGEVVNKNDVQSTGMATMDVPDGKLA